ncbi:EamA family transporter [Mesorhizobium opportunistum]|uniref:EamA family transporter n=1 Tax=Mesorhizobium opportunistum TaxID=593909 RepID=A0ABV1YBI2_9HYPH|nr:EamA family transporter [Mesorhizobium sp.]TIN90730.1 MAG: EamA/RhaT family transporter [Mesorhizobium sp.]TJU97910.1 MAG: EamA/RhaT family transporter [Mesorhizobium sp.]TJV16277.1 MAG: EamA/RhaT family transporter [Mesorhizobium sp.]
MSRLHANLLLLFAAALWGFGNVPQKTVLDHLDPLSAVGMRCLIAGLLVLPLMFREGQMGTARISAKGFRASLARVVALFAVSIALQQIGYLDTSVTNASFLIATATVMTPMAAWLLIGERATAAVGLAACISLTGALLLADGITSLSRGDMAVLLSAACYALWTVELGRHVQAYGRPFTTMAAQFLGAAAIALPLSMLHGNLSAVTAVGAWPQLLLLGVFSTAAPFGIQTVAQRFTPASHAAVIVSAESIFGALGAALFLGERISSTGAFGATMMLGAILFLTLSAGAGKSAETAVTPVEDTP